MTPRFCFLLVGALAIFGCGGSSMRPATASSAPMDDATITARVKTVLLNDTQVGATKIDVTTNAGVVTIAGTVKSKAEEARAIELARQVTGVRDVKSALTIPQL
jgi:hyperosmotically inducible protein